MIYYFVSSKAFSDIYGQTIKQHNPFVTGMCVFLGVYAFGIKGIVFGPLLTSMISLVIDLGVKHIEKKQIDELVEKISGTRHS